ncbi:putative transcription regulator SWI/SNF-BAF60b family [Lupinus albus]|uniref:Putative transcription regulator SWI/SNF-BAF60b family n=1 Tax=Lupinus albus TaxID=3870 RepID=A0A6A4NWI0_LUPAL|nr:putative transcription regulator SWI/SNF-BAF60b family [Lupinus albus]
MNFEAKAGLSLAERVGYIRENNLVHPSKIKRVVCVERLHSVFDMKPLPS